MSHMNESSSEADSFKFSVIDSIMEPMSDENADWVSAIDNCVIWMDGAAPLNPSSYTAYPNDAAWLSRRFSEIFMSKVAGAHNTSSLVDSVQRQLFFEYKNIAPKGIDYEAPFACFGCARLVEETIELTNAGDCIVIYEESDGVLRSFGYNTVSILDDQALEALTIKKESYDISHADAFSYVKPIILENRARRNTMFGYDVVEPSEYGSTTLERCLIPARHGQRFLAMSDGCYRAINTYGAYSLRDLFEMAHNEELDIVSKTIRTIERGDPEATLHPRIKLQDDISAIAFKVV